MKSIGAEFLRPDGLPGVNHMRVMQCQMVLNITFWSELIYTVNRPLVAFYDIPG